MMSNLIIGDFGKNRCRNSEAEIERDQNTVDLTQPAKTGDEILLHDRIIELIGDPNANDTNFWYEFWENNLDVWADFATISTDRNARKLLEDWQYNFYQSRRQCVSKYQAWIDLQKQPEFGKIFDIVHSAIELLTRIQDAAQDQAEREFNNDH